jgi:hypothetical protein
VVTRPLQYPHGWPSTHEPGARPREKGIDIALAIDFVTMAIRSEYDVGILMSTDTDLKPALEAVAELTDTQGTRAEVAAWSSPEQHSRRLSIHGVGSRGWSLRKAMIAVASSGLATAVKWLPGTRVNRALGSRAASAPADA